MKRMWLLIAGVLSVLALVGLAGCSQGSPQGSGLSVPSISGINVNSQQTGLWVSGMGSVSAAPDIANLTLGIQAQAASVADAQSQAATAMSDVMKALTGNGVAQKDIQTRSFSIQQLTRYDKDKQQDVVIGYQVANTVNAKIRAIDKAGAVIDAVAKAGGNLTRINGISFSIDDPTAYYKDARQKAMADAKDKADQMAAAAGVKLGKPTYMSESSYLPPSPTPILRAGAAAAPAMETPISPGETKITVNVQVAYAIQ